MICLHGALKARREDRTFKITRYLKLLRVCEGGQWNMQKLLRVCIVDVVTTNSTGLKALDSKKHCHIALCTRVKSWPPQHIPIVVHVRRVGLVDLGDSDIAILRLPTLRGLFDFSGLPLGGGILDLDVYVSHGRSRCCLFLDITERGRDPNSNGEYQWLNRRNYSRMFNARDGGEFGI